MLGGVILVAHGGIPKDFPKEQMHDEAKLRNWPRSYDNDPYWVGVQKVAKEIQKRLLETPFAVAYNEFCAPTLKEAVRKLHSEGVRSFTILSTMIIPGGSHSEKDIPATIEEVKKAFPECTFHYNWPYPIKDLGDFFIGQLKD
jgi:sirohydrochlorin cobaltochelatase